MKDHIVKFLKSILERKALFSFVAECLVTFAWLWGWTHVNVNGSPTTGVDFAAWQLFTGVNFAGYATTNVTEKKIIPGVAPEPPAA